MSSGRFRVVVDRNHTILEFNSLDGSCNESTRARDVLLRDAATVLCTAAGLDAARELMEACKRRGVDPGEALRDEVIDQGPVDEISKAWEKIDGRDSDELLRTLERSLHRIVAEPRVELAMLDSWRDYESIERAIRGAARRVDEGLVGI